MWGDFFWEVSVSYTHLTLNFAAGQRRGLWLYFRLLRQSYVSLHLWRYRKIQEEQYRYCLLYTSKKALEACFGITEEAVDKVIEENPEGRYNIMLKGATYAQAQAFAVMLSLIHI